MADANPKNERAAVASHVPGRVRVKFRPGHRDRETLESIRGHLAGKEGIGDVRLNAANGSMTVHYDRRRHSMASILRLLEDLDVVVDAVGHLPSVGEGSAAVGPRFITAIDDLNRRIRRTTGLPIDLKLVLPLTFVGAGVWSTVRKGLMIESVPGWLFFWFAFDMFVKLHSSRAESREGES